MTGDSTPILGSEYKDGEYKFAQYVGKSPLDLAKQQTPVAIDATEARGDLTLGLKAWVFKFDPNGTVLPISFGNYENHLFEVTAIADDLCRLEIRDQESGSVVVSSDVSTSADTLRNDFSGRDGNVPPEVAERVAKEIAERKEQLQARFAELQSSGDALLKDVSQQIERAWWVAPHAFGAFGRSGSFLAKETHYLGGWPGHTKTYTGKLTHILVVDQKGVSLRGLSTIFTIPWKEITDLEVDGTENASKRVTVGRVAMIGVFALAAKKKVKDSMLIVTTQSGDQALFQSAQFTSLELRQKLLPIITQVRKSNTGSSVPVFAAPPAVAPAASLPASVADELAKLAQLRDSGILSDEEFAKQKSKLLG